MDKEGTDKVTRRRDMNANTKRLFEEHDERVRINQEQRAKEHGFSTYKEYEAFEMQQWKERDDKFYAALAEECKRLGKTVEQYWAEHPQCDTPERPECKCEVHINPLFCPQSLLPYNSVGENAPGLLQYCRPAQIEKLSMNEDDKSRRHSDYLLERLWMMDSQEIPLRLPQWTTRDPVVKTIASTTIEHQNSRLSWSSTSSFVTPSKLVSPPKFENNARSDLIQLNPTSQTDSMVHMPKLPEPTFKPSKKFAAQTTRQDQLLSWTKKPNASRLSKPSGIKKNIRKRTRRSQNQPRHPMQTRSRGAITFYALKSRNSTMSWRSPRRR